jgi:hypothetical protein
MISTWNSFSFFDAHMDGLHNLVCRAAVQYEDNDSYKQPYSPINKLNVTNEIEGLIYGCTNLLFN